MKKWLILLLALFVLLLCGCGNSTSQPQGPVIPDDAVAVETKFGSLYFSGDWERDFVITKTEDENKVSVLFSAAAKDGQIDLFLVEIGAGTGDKVGTLTDVGGVVRDVYVTLYDINDSVTDDQLFAMQEDVNVLIDALH